MKTKKILTMFGIVAFFSLSFIIFHNVLAAVSVTPATGGSSISADTVGGAYTSLTGPIVSEGAVGDVGVGTIVFNAPSGFVFDTGGTAPTVKIDRTSGNGADTRNVNSVPSGTSVAITSISTSQITFTVTSAGTNGVKNSLTWQNVRVRPSAVTPLASGNITKTGTSTVTGITNSVTNLGTLTEVAGTPTPTPTSTPTPTPTPTPTATPTATPTSTPTPTPTATPTATPTPTTTPTPTPTPTPEPPTIETVPSSAGGSVPTKIIFSGEAYPDALIKVDLLDYVPGFPGAPKVLRNLASIKTDSKGRFEISYEEGSSGEHLYGLSLINQSGNTVSAKVYTYKADFNIIIRQENIIFAPALSASKTLLAKSDTLVVSGYGSSNNTIQVLKNGSVVANSKADSNGKYLSKINAGNLNTGSNKIQVRQVDEETGKSSELSEIKTVTVGQFAYVSVDMNKDGKIDISDWSIFLSNWSNTSQAIKIKDDLNGDQKVDVTDFGIFLTSFKVNL